MATTKAEVFRMEGNQWISAVKGIVNAEISFKPNFKQYMFQVSEPSKGAVVISRPLDKNASISKAQETFLQLWDGKSYYGFRFTSSDEATKFFDASNSILEAIKKSAPPVATPVPTANPNIARSPSVVTIQNSPRAATVSIPQPVVTQPPTTTATAAAAVTTRPVVAQPVNDFVKELAARQAAQEAKHTTQEAKPTTQEVKPTAQEVKPTTQEVKRPVQEVKHTAQQELEVLKAKVNEMQKENDSLKQQVTTANKKKKEIEEKNKKLEDEKHKLEDEKRKFEEEKNLAASDYS